MKKTVSNEIELNKTINQQSKLIDELKKENYQLKNILEKLPGSIYCKNEKGAYLYCNRFVLEMANLKNYSQIINKTDFDMPWKEYAEELHRLDQRVIKSQVALELEEYPIVNNKKITMLTRKMPFLDEKGQAIGIIGVSLDITERKKLEENLKVAKEKAEVANQAKTEFLENMRHDIRTPLSGIVGCAQLIKIKIQANNPKKVAEYTDDLVQSSGALLEFLNKILESIQVATGEIPLLKKKFDLYRALEQVVCLNKPQAHIKHLSLHLDYDRTIPAYLLGDPIRVQRIVLELITNALKFTDKGKIKISVHLMENKTQAGQLIIKISVSDTGMGIPLDKQNEVYTRFKRLTPSYQGIYPGTGLGLSVVKQFVDDLGGEIHLDSIPNQGSTFTCLIPFQESLSTKAKNELEETQSFDVDIRLVNKKAAKSPASQEMVITTGSRVLVVEDNLIAAKVAQGVLLNLNCQVDIAPDGKIALSCMEKNHYDLILMDIGLPDNDGCEVTRRIRLKQWQRNPSVPIVGLTAHITAEKKRSCLANGMNAIYTKPFTSDKASEILNAFLSHQQLSVSQAQSAQALDNLQTIPVLDRERAIQLLGSEEMFKESLALLVSSLTEELKCLKEYHQTKEWSAIKALAHKWKSGASYCGTLRLEKACEEIGNVLKTESVEKTEELYQQLLQVAEATKEAAKKALNSEV